MLVEVVPKAMTQTPVPMAKIRTDSQAPGTAKMTIKGFLTA